ncbi:LAQU0S06e05710g1_1 [Lachancea quebecensis]|uniref:LAQU0S06e05710g1_1 n=1 Tax=Lachancea quebecensis TaxID=1654605 RepID=A0A0P1KT29_9SACH|nr:LAQU0S06e05710g1_1 [Lachancea quebecensis]
MASKDTPRGKVNYFTKELAKEHELYLLKHALLIYNDPNLSLGPLNEPPSRSPMLPTYVIRERIADTGDCYVIARGDQQGEAKIDRKGNLLGSRNFLFPTFTLPSRPHAVYVLVKDLIKCLESSLSPKEFLQQNAQLYGVEAGPEEFKFLKESRLCSGDEINDDASFVTTKSVFMLFGARVVVGGTRLVDDYWEQITKEQGFLPHHRVFAINSKILEVLRTLKPSATYDRTDKAQDCEIPNEPSYQIVSEQPSWELRQEYAREITQGEHLSVIVPGQNITGSLELSAQFKLPKYHGKTSLQAAVQAGTQDTPIGVLSVPTNTSQSAPPETVNKSDKRLLSGILYPLAGSKLDKNGGHQGSGSNSSHDVSLNVNGWKFEIPVRSDPSDTRIYSSKGLPIHDSWSIVDRLKKLTPNEINEMQHTHDSVYVNTGLQKARQTRKTRWIKYWQYKAGVPIGTTQRNASAIIRKYLKELETHIEIVRTLDEVNDREQVTTIKRVPNPNFLGHSNITGLKPPYISE